MNTYEYKDLKEGMKETFQKKITSEDILLFSKITGDRNSLHLDEDYAKTTQFGKKVVFGLLVNSLLSTLAGMHLPGKYSLILKVESNFKKPCFEGDILTVSGEIEKKNDFGKIIILKTAIENQKKDVVQEGKMYIQVLK